MGISLGLTVDEDLEQSRELYRLSWHLKAFCTGSDPLGISDGVEVSLGIYIYIYIYIRKEPNFCTIKAQELVSQELQPLIED